jgi:hypothetical protein
MLLKSDRYHTAHIVGSFLPINQKIIRMLVGSVLNYYGVKAIPIVELAAVVDPSEMSAYHHLKPLGSVECVLTDPRY